MQVRIIIRCLIDISVSSSYNSSDHNYILFHILSGSAYSFISYVLVKSGSKCTRITSLYECSRAARALRLSDTTAKDDGQSGVSYDPPYCYFEGGTLKYNSNGLNTGVCTATDSCVCRTKSTYFPQEYIPVIRSE